MIKLLEMAAKLALGGNQRRNFRLAAISVRADGAMTWSLNEHTITPNPKCHAEARVLQKSDWGATLYVARVIRDGTWAISRPCPRCQAAIRNKGVKKVVYTIGPGEYGIWWPQESKNP